MKNIYLGWVAFNNDPYTWDDKSKWSNANERFELDSNGRPKTGPTLSFLTESEYKDEVAEAHLLCQDDEHSQQAFLLLKDELHARSWAGRLYPHICKLTGSDVIDHEKLYGIMRPFVQDLVSRFRKDSKPAEVTFLVNISPGTPAMHAVWIILTQVEKALFDPFELRVYQGVPREKRKGGTGPLRLVPAQLKLPSFSNLARQAYVKEHRKGAPTGQATIDPFEGIENKTMLAALEAMQQAAAVNYPVVMLGERGVGKTTRAKEFLHMCGKRAKGPFVPVVCGEHSDDSMLKGELFGWKKGAFTGAVRNYGGALKRADKGTLFLDEIGDMSRPLQRMLIAAVESKEFLPLAGTRRETSDFRLVCASNRSMADLRCTLDDDFRDRIFHVQIQIPPLRDRREDLPHIWRRVFQAMSERSGLLAVDIDDADQEKIIGRLLGLQLPGNIRSLERLAVLVISRSIRGGEDRCRVRWDVAEKQLELLEDEEARNEDVLRQRML